MHERAHPPSSRRNRSHFLSQPPQFAGSPDRVGAFAVAKNRATAALRGAHPHHAEPRPSCCRRLAARAAVFRIARDVRARLSAGREPWGQLWGSPVSLVLASVPESRCRRRPSARRTSERESGDRGQRRERCTHARDYYCLSSLSEGLHSLKRRFTAKRICAATVHFGRKGSAIEPHARFFRRAPNPFADCTSGTRHEVLPRVVAAARARST